MRETNEASRSKSVATVETGHGQLCYYCKNPCNVWSASPSQWPIPLCHEDDPGRVKWHHTGCISSRLIELEIVRGDVDKLEIAFGLVISKVPALFFYDKITEEGSPLDKLAYNCLKKFDEWKKEHGETLPGS